MKTKFVILLLGYEKNVDVEWYHNGKDSMQKFKFRIISIHFTIRRKIVDRYNDSLEIK